MMIVPYKDVHKEDLLTVFDENTPAFFDPSERNDFINYLDEELEDYFAILVENTAVGGGGLNYLHEKKIARISWGLISARLHGQGLGSKLLTHRVDHAKKLFPEYKVDLRTSQLTFGFYKKHGFKVVEEVQDYWAKGYHLFHMERG